GAREAGERQGWRESVGPGERALPAPHQSPAGSYRCYRRSGAGRNPENDAATPDTGTGSTPPA
ncbi:hypothetical protein, partial [Microbulbifer halophilus]|uniref:hypothetical protein n=1 Tax=Microbulbifer halophilus TaxID=453963 RepID=UPI0036435F10